MTMATPDMVAAQRSVPDDVLRSFVEMAITGSRVSVTFAAVPQDNPGETTSSGIRWLSPTTAAMARLPWFETNLPDGRTPPQPEAAANLLWLMAMALENNTIPPTGIIPTWRGGVTAEWHVNGFDLEIECDPSGTIEYNFAGPGVEEYEGPVDETLSQLKWHVGMLPLERE